MYVGDTGEYGLHYLLWLLLENCLQEIEYGACRNIQIELLPQVGCSIRDDGRGISVDFVEQWGRRYLEAVFTQFGGGNRGRPFQTRAGLFGVGLVSVNSLSRSLVVEVHREGTLWRQEYERGKPISPLQPIRRTQERGTSITFYPDPEI